MREDLYKAKVTAAANLHKTGAWDMLSAEQKRLVEKMLLDGKRAGLALERKEDREKLKTLKDELSDACLKFTVGRRSSCLRYGRSGCAKSCCCIS